MSHVSKTLAATLAACSMIVLALSASAQADEVSTLNLISKSSIGSGALGTVTLTQNGADEVDVAVVLAANTGFVDTGGPHNAFTFNLDLATPPVMVDITTPATGFSNVTSPTNTPFGTFTNGMDCPSCGPGASNAYFGPLDFKVTNASGISISDFVLNGTLPNGYFFSADVIGPLGGTGNIASQTLVATVGGGEAPIPGTLLLMGSALAFAALFMWRAQRRREESLLPVY